jgi:type II secretory pathway predicted ATPase ExeA
MSVEERQRIIIPTLSHQLLKSAVDVVVRTAGLGIVKGAVGIGKTFALRQIADQLVDEGVDVVMITSSPEIEGSIRSFCTAVVGDVSDHKRGAAEALFDALRGYPFRDPPQPVIFIVDEAQGLKSNVLEFLRSLWDRGDRARLISRNAPAFGLLLCGNETFLNRGRAGEKQAEYRPLRDRVTVNMTMPRPDPADFIALSKAMLPDNPEAQEELARGGAEAGTLRSIEKAYHFARIQAGDGEITAALIRNAFTLRGGR